MSKVNLNKEMQLLQIGKPFQNYTGVRVLAGKDDDGNDIVYFAGDESGYVLEIDNPFATRETAVAVLDGLKKRGAKYNPFSANAAPLDPAAEIGDSVTADETDSIIFSVTRDLSHLMAADVAAPYEEEIDHEFTYVPKQTREFRRESAYTRSRLTITDASIVAEVERATAEEGKLSAQLAVEADRISAEVSRATTAEEAKLNHTRADASFGWKLDADGFYINADGNQNILTATRDGIVIQGNATVEGEIRAKSGYIGSSTYGFTITERAIYNGKTSLDDENDGVYIGRDGISLGSGGVFTVTRTGAVTAKNLKIAGGSINIKDQNGADAFTVSQYGNVTMNGFLYVGDNFSVTKTGNVTANNMTLKGTLHIIDEYNTERTITAENLRSKAVDAYDWAYTPSQIYGGMSPGGYALGGAPGGYSFSKATEYGTDSYPAWFRCGGLITGSMYLGSEQVQCFPTYADIPYGDGSRSTRIYYVGWIGSD